MLKNQLEGATELMKMIMCKRRSEIQPEETSDKSFTRRRGRCQKTTLEVEVIDKPSRSKNGNDKFLTIAKYSLNKDSQEEDKDTEASIKALRQREDMSRKNKTRDTQHDGQVKMQHREQRHKRKRWRRKKG